MDFHIRKIVKLVTPSPKESQDSIPVSQSDDVPQESESPERSSTQSSQRGTSPVASIGAGSSWEEAKRMLSQDEQETASRFLPGNEDLQSVPDALVRAITAKREICEQ